MKNKEKAELRKKHLQQREELFKNEAFVKEYNLVALEYRVAEILHEAREAAKISQKEIAERLGTKQSAISRIEKGCNISIETIAKYAGACGKRVKLELCDNI